MKKTKKILAMLLAGIMLVGMVGCGSSDNGDGSTWKIGVITGTVSQGEEEYRAAQNVQAKYGEDHVVLQTYPDKFMDEQETVIANIVGVGSDPDVKAIIICQAVPGTSAAIDKLKEVRGDDLLIICGTPQEDPPVLAKRADMSFAADEISMGNTIPEQAKKMGAKTLVHYSFPRHMAIATLSTRRDLMVKKCKELGIKFVDATAPDPTGDAGTSGAQQFVLEDVPKLVEKYGKDTAFFSTNCAMQEPLIKAVMESGALYPQPCCPSPYHGFPAALGIEIPEDKQGDREFIIEKIKEAVKEKGMTGRLSTWSASVSMTIIEGAAVYAKDYAEGKITDKKDYEAIKKCFKDYAGVDIKYSTYKENGKEYKDYVFLLLDYLNF